MKRCLKKILKNARVTSEELQTVLVEIEATLNSRPLTFVSSGDIEEPLTPSHLLCRRRLLDMPGREEIEISQIDSEEVRGREARLERLKDHFWRHWRNEYLLELRNSHRLKIKDDQGQTVDVGDIVIVHEDGLQRGLWKLGQVEKLITGKDGLARGAVVKSTTPKKGKSTMLRRPLQRLYTLELGSHPQWNSTADNSDVPARTVDVEERPRREAARRVDSQRRSLIENQLL